MRRADIEVPNPAVDLDSWAGSACYPRGSFYPISHGPSTRYRGITKPCFRTSSACSPRCQAPFYLCALRPVAIRPEGTVGRLRYFLGGDRPSQTPRQPPSRRGIPAGEWSIQYRVVFHRCLQPPRKGTFAGSHLSYAVVDRTRWQARVKLHGVFLSCCGMDASSRPVQFHRAPC